MTWFNAWDSNCVNSMLQLVQLLRRRTEGEKPLCQRKEFETRDGDDITERRVIRVKEDKKKTSSAPVAPQK